MVAILCLIRFI